MARVVAFIPDLLFGSNVLGALQAAGHDSVLVAGADGLGEALGGADVLIVDLTDDASVRIVAALGALATRGAPGAAGSPGSQESPESSESAAPRTLAFFSHVEGDVRVAAEQAGFDLVVPRSRMARATADLVAQLTG